MDCSEVKELLSAYYDDELPSDKRAAVEQHLSGCDDCSRELQEFHNLSAMTEQLTHPEPPVQIWRQLNEQLDVAGDVDSKRPGLPQWLGWTRNRAVQLGLAIAATTLIAVAWFGSRPSEEHGGDAEFAAVFGHYLEEFRRDPQAAQKFLLAKYGGQAVDAEEASAVVGYRPAVADGLPDGYSVESTYVMKMPCCTCVQCQCNCSDGSTVAIFEHDDEEPEWFGDRRQTEAICSGTSCTLVDLDDKIAATWKRGDRYITVIGMRNTAEIEQLVAWFDDRKRVRVQQ